MKENLPAIAGEEQESAEVLEFIAELMANHEPNLPNEGEKERTDIQNSVADEGEIDEKDEAKRIAGVLISLDESGKIHGDVNEYLGDEAFVALLAEFSPEAAVRIYEAEAAAFAFENAAKNAEEELLEKLLNRRMLPSQQKSKAPVSLSPDFSKMSSEAFLKFKDDYFKRKTI